MNLITNPVQAILQAAVALTVGLTGFCSTSAGALPNLVVLLADDLGWADVGYHGSEIRTPHLDSLAERSVILDQFYVQPTCTPTRIALMTGRYPYRCGGQICVLRSHHQHCVPLDERFLSEALQQAGYKTSITGKWHLGHGRRAYWPASRGFDLTYGCLGGAVDYFTRYASGSLDWYDNDRIPLHEEGYSTDLIGERAVRVVQQHDFGQQPLFLYVPFTAPHTPQQAKGEDLATYKKIKDGRRRKHAAMVTAMDRQIGAVLSAIKSRGQTDNTLVFFASDNGGHDKGANNAPLRGGKGSLYEGGVRVPALVSWPTSLDAGRTVSQPIHVVDLFPTLVGLAGGALETGKPLDGMDVWPAIASGQALPERDIIHNLLDKTGRGAIRRGDWKLVIRKDRFFKTGMKLGRTSLRGQLFNVRKDPNETKDLSASHKQTVLDLWAALKQRGPEVGDSRPYCAKAPEGWKAPADWSGVPE